MTGDQALTAFDQFCLANLTQFEADMRADGVDPAMRAEAIAFAENKQATSREELVAAFHMPLRAR